MTKTQAYLNARMLPARKVFSETVDDGDDPNAVNTDFPSPTRPRVIMLGMRGFPDVQGGVEKHTEKLARALLALGWNVEAIVRNRYVSRLQKSWCGVNFTRIWAPHIKGLETVIHSFLGVLYAGISRPDILHIHGIGPAFFVPLARAFGLKVVVTCHSLNYQHRKWGLLARSIFRAGEWAGMRFANGRISVSRFLADKMRSAYDVSVSTIPNGIDKPANVRSRGTLDKFGLEADRYALCVARIDEEKRQLDLIRAYSQIATPDFKLVLAGDVDYSGRHARMVSEVVKRTPGVVMLGYQSAASLAELYANAAIFVLPSANEGQPIVVLEALSYGLPVLLSDIAAHRDMTIPRVRYFPVGDIEMLTKYLAEISEAPPQRLSVLDRRHVLAKYEWREIATRTLEVYVSALGSSRNPVLHGSFSRGGMSK